jgi:hypothetical protein
VVETLKASVYLYFMLGDSGDNSTRIAKKCGDDVIATFLLVLEEGSILGCNGWDDRFGYALGDPLGPPQLVAVEGTVEGAVEGAVVERKFKSGTVARFDPATKKYTVDWAGHTPPPTPAPPPTPLPPPPPPPTPPPPMPAYCSKVMEDTGIGADDIHVQMTTAFADCCVLCHGRKGCVAWSWHHETVHQKKNQCHLHGASAHVSPDVHKGCTSGFVNGTR